MSTRTRADCIYFAADEVNQTVKIGISNNARYRLTTIQTSYPFPLRLLLCIETIHAARIEKHIHKKLNTIRLNGEWFILTQELQSFIKKLSSVSNKTRIKRIENMTYFDRYSINHPGTAVMTRYIVERRMAQDREQKTTIEIGREFIPA